MTTALERAPDASRVSGFPKKGEVRIIDPGPRRCLAVDGAGAPGSPDFLAAVQALYSVAYGIHFRLRLAGVQERIGALEGLWDWGDGVSNPADATAATVDRDAWRWTLLIEIPGAAGDEDIAAARTDAAAKRPLPGLARLRVMTFDEGPVVEALHVGPYATEPETKEKMTRVADAAGLRMRPPHHEIYLGDPRRSAPDRLRTVLREPVA